MNKQFVQFSAHKDSNNFAHCSNLSLMANDGLTVEQAEQDLQSQAADYAARGYEVVWIREDLTDEDLELYGDLFVQSEYDGQPDEAQEWHDFDPEC